MTKFSTYLLFFFLVFIANAKGQNASPSDLNSFFEQSELFFSTYAQHNSVQYKVLKGNSKELDDLVLVIQEMNLEKASKREKKAFLINAYNLLVIKNVVTHYPITSPNEIVEFWDEIEFAVLGKKYTLENLKAKILNLFPDPHLHFALVDASVSAAPIAEFAYVPSKLEAQLENRTIEALNNSKFIIYDKLIEEVLIPRTFKTYAEHFEPSVLAFINQYRAIKISEEAIIKFAHYDWTLNSFFSDIDLVVNTRKVKKKGGYTSPAQIITLPKNGLELILFNNIFTATYGDNTYGSRSSFFNSYLSAYYGINGRVDIGMSFLLRSSRMGDPYNASPFKTLEFERSALNPNPRSSQPYSDFGLSHIGMQVRFAPFKNINLTFEQGFLFPIKDIPEGTTVDRSIYNITQAFYVQPITSKMHLFLALTFWQPIVTGQEFKFQPPLLRGILSYTLTPRFSVFATTTYFVEWGAGFRFLLTPKFEVQAFYSYFIPIPELFNLFSQGATSIMTYNLGLKYRF